MATRGTTILLSQSLLSGFFRVLNLVILTRLLLQEEMGIVAILGIVYGFMQFIGVLGLNHASPLLVPELEAKGEQERVKSYLWRSSLIVVVTSSLLVLLVFMLLPVIVEVSQVTESFYQFLLYAVPFSALEVFLDSFILARYSVKRLATGRILFDAVRMTSTVLLVLNGMGVMGVVLGWFVSEIVAVILFGVIATRDLPHTMDPIAMRPVLAFAIPSLIFQAVDVTIQNTDRIILHQISGLSALGVYDVFLRMLFLFSFMALAIATSLYPVLTRVRVRLDQENDLGSLDGVIVLLERYVLILLMPLAVIAALNSKTILTILFGSQYADFPDASFSFSLLILSYVLWGIVYAIHSVLRSMGEAQFFIYSGTGIIIFEVIGCLYLTSVLGLLGCAIIRCMYIVLLFAAALVRLRQRGIRTLRMLWPSTVRISAASIVSGILVFLMFPSDLLSLIMWVATGLTLYLLLLFASREVNRMDFRLVRTVLPHFCHGFIDYLERRYHH